MTGDDAGELDEVVDGVQWDVGGRAFPTKGEAIAYAWSLTPAGGKRPDVRRKRRETDRMHVATAERPDRVKVEFSLNQPDMVDVSSWGDGVVSRYSVGRPTVTVTAHVPVWFGMSGDELRDKVGRVLEMEASARALRIISVADITVHAEPSIDGVVAIATAIAEFIEAD